MPLAYILRNRQAPLPKGHLSTRAWHPDDVKNTPSIHYHWNRKRCHWWWPHISGIRPCPCRWAAGKTQPWRSIAWHCTRAISENTTTQGRDTQIQGMGHPESKGHAGVILYIQWNNKRICLMVKENHPIWCDYANLDILINRVSSTPYIDRNTFAVLINASFLLFREGLSISPLTGINILAIIWH